MQTTLFLLSINGKLATINIGLISRHILAHQNHGRAGGQTTNSLIVSASQDVESFAVETESLSGDIMVTWGHSGGSDVSSLATWKILSIQACFFPAVISATGCLLF